ncbi:MAG: hypothetical protein ACLQB1_07150 [Streptosporangiaceae bacterium]
MTKPDAQGVLAGSKDASRCIGYLTKYLTKHVGDCHQASKTLADHRADRKAWLTGMLGLSATDLIRYTWEPVKPGDPDYMPNGQRLLHVVADRIQWQTALEQARRRAADQAASDSSATGRAA